MVFWLVEMARDLSPDIERLLENPNPYIRKKAALCSIRCDNKTDQCLHTLTPIEAVPSDTWLPVASCAACSDASIH